MGLVRKATAATGSALFLVLVPGLVAGLGPWLLTRWRASEPFAYWLPVKVLGFVLVVVGAAVLVHAFGRFVVEGLGTPAPVAPPSRLVVGGLYRYLRNPMYAAVAATLVGQTLILARPVLLAYTVAFVVLVAAFVRWYEEPALRRQFPDEYEAYRRAVPGWWPRSRPWKGDHRDR